MININFIQKVILVVKYPQTTIRFIKNAIFYHQRLTIYPDSIHINITERCNFNCPMCHIKNSRLRNMNQLSFNDLRPLFNESKKYFPVFQFSGGEPLLQPEIFTILSYLHKNHFVTGLVTNGLLLKKYAKKLFNSGLNFLAISLDGPDETTQYKRGLVKRSFLKIITGIKKIIEVRGENLFPNIRIATVISSLNINNFDKIAFLASKLKANQWSLSHHFYFNDLIHKQQENFSKKYDMGSDIWGEYIGSRKEFFNLQERKTIKNKLNLLYRLQPRYSKHIRLSLPNQINIDQYYQSQPPGPKSFCNSYNHQVFIRGNGDVEMCQGYILGNIKKDSLYHIWNGPKAKHFRLILSQHKLTPACFRCCSLNLSF